MFPDEIKNDDQNVFSGERELGTELEDFGNDHINRYRFVQYFVCTEDVVLDAACGVGYGSNMIAQRAKLVNGIDYNSQALDYAKQHWQKNNISFYQGDLQKNETYPKGEKYDKIISFETIEHLKEDKCFLELLSARLKKGGLLFISAPNSDIMDASQNPWHERHYTPLEFKNILAGYFKYIEEFTQIENGIRKGRGGDNNILVCSNTPILRIFILKWRLHQVLYRLKCCLLK